MKELKNGWVKYWNDRVSEDNDYYGKEGSNADEIIEILNIKKKDKVLDIGCAVGAHLSDIKDKTGANCYGYDISETAIKLCKDKRIKLKVADMENSGYKKNTFDKVFTLGVFEHTPRSLNPFKELNRIMKVGGKAYVTVPNKTSMFHITKNIKMRLGTWNLGYEKSFTKPEIISLLNKTGFALEKFYIQPHGRNANIFNFIDNVLNKIDSQRFGFFTNFTVRKIKSI